MFFMFNLIIIAKLINNLKIFNINFMSYLIQQIVQFINEKMTKSDIYPTKFCFRKINYVI